MGGMPVEELSFSTDCVDAAELYIIPRVCPVEGSSNTPVIMVARARQARFDLIVSIVGDDGKQVAAAVVDGNSTIPATAASAEQALLPRVQFINSLCELFHDDPDIVPAIAKDPNVSSLRDVALNYDRDTFAQLLSTQTAAIRSVNAVPGPSLSSASPSPSLAATASAMGFQKKLFLSQPSAVLHRMVIKGNLSVGLSVRAQKGVAQFFYNQKDFDIRKTSVKKAFTAPNAFDGIPLDVIPDVKTHMATIQRVQALTSTPDAIPHMLDAGITSAFQVSTFSRDQFKAKFAGTLSPETASSIHSHALNARFVQENRLTAMHQHVRGTKLKAIDGLTTQQDRLDRLQDIVSDTGINLTELFGSLDYCTCSDCNSILSPAAYFVELLNFLRNNNFHIDPTAEASNLLDALLRRRPDIARVELTCANTNTVLPYIDLALEIMESFVVHLDQYQIDKSRPKQVSLDVFNTTDNDPSGLLLAASKNTNYEAYAIVKDATYPFSLPYNRGIDEIRVYLNWLGTSRWELIDVFRSSCTPIQGVDATELQNVCDTSINRARDAEFLGMLLDEYKIIFKEVFWPKKYFDLTTSQILTVPEYQACIEMQPVYVYWGYCSEDEFTDPTTSLANVAAEFLPRSGMAYSDLVELVKTSFINPYYPQGWPLQILESIRGSYLFLQSLVLNQFTDPRRRFARLIQHLNTHQSLGVLYDIYKKGLVGAEPSHTSYQSASSCSCSCDFRIDYRFWVYKYFEQLGKIIVLDAGVVPTRDNIQGYVYYVGVSALPPLAVYDTSKVPRIGQLFPDGTIKDSSSNILGNVNPDFTVTFNPPSPMQTDYRDYSIQIVSLDVTAIIGYAQGKSSHPGYLELLDTELPFPLKKAPTSPLTSRIGGWWTVDDTCDLSKVKLVHLNGTPLTYTEYDRMMQFIRLRNRLGWTVDELDKALAGLAQCNPKPKPPVYGGSSTIDKPEITFKDLRDTDAVEICEMHGSSQAPKPALVIIESCFVGQAVAVQKLLQMTRFPLIKLLTFWANISTVGDKSLYSQLFLPTDIVGMDPIFQADDNGNYLQQLGIKLSDHYPAVQAAMQIRAATDLITIITNKTLTDELNISNLSVIYRHVLLAKFLSIPIPTLFEAIKTFQKDPFASAEQTYDSLTLWTQMLSSGFSYRSAWLHSQQ